MAKGFFKKMDEAVFGRAASGSMLKVVAPYRPQSSFIGGKERRQYLDFSDPSTAIEKGYESSALIYRLIRRKQDNIASLRWIVRQHLGGGKFTDLTDHEASRIINDPNENYTSWYMMHRAVGFLSSLGQVYFGMFGPGMDGESKDVVAWRKNEESQLRVESPVGVVPVEGQNGWIVRYERGAGKDDWDPSTIIDVKIPSLNESGIVGMGELKALSLSGDMDIEHHQWNLNSFGSGGMPTTIMVDYTQTEDTIEEARTQIEARFSNRGRSKLPWLIPGERIPSEDGYHPAIEVHKLSMGPQEMDNIRGQEYTRDELTFGFGFHPSDASNDKSTFENRRVSKVQAWEEAYIPLLHALSSAFSLKILTREERRSGLVISPDLSQVEALQEGKVRKSEIFRNIAPSKQGLSIPDAAKFAGIEITDKQGSESEDSEEDS